MIWRASTSVPLLMRLHSKTRLNRRLLLFALHLFDSHSALLLKVERASADIDNVAAAAASSSSGGGGAACELPAARHHDPTYKLTDFGHIQRVLGEESYKTMIRDGCPPASPMRLLALFVQHNLWTLKLLHAA